MKILGLLFLFVIAVPVHATEVPLNSVAIVRVHEAKKTLGKGLADHETGERIQLACIGERLEPNGLERKCDTLRFLYATEGGEEYLVGPVFSLSDQESMRGQMKKAFAYWDLSKDLKQQRSFMVTRMIYTGFFNNHRSNVPDPSSDTRNGLQIGIIVAQGVGIKLLMVAGASEAVALGGFILGSLLAPVILDLAILPITLMVDGKNAKSIWGFSGRDLSTLQSRASPAWSIKPRKTKSRRFQVLLRSLLQVGSSDASTASIREILNRASDE